MHYRMSENRHAAIFGPSDPMDSHGPGRTRKCKVCGGWHRLDAWPHNCRSERPPRADLAAPMVAPPFEAFKPNVTEDVVVGDRKAKREYMKERGLVEYDEGVDKRNHWVEDQDHSRDIIADMKRFRDTDTDYYDPANQVAEIGADPDVAVDIDPTASDIKIIDDTPS